MARFTHPGFGNIAGPSTTTEIQAYTPIWNTVSEDMTFSADPSPIEGYYIKIGNWVIVQIDAPMSNVTNFGSDGYTLTLPFASKYHTDVYGGSIHQTVNQGVDHYSIKGHLTDGETKLNIFVLGSNAQDEPMTHTTPVNLDSADRFHMSFSYIAE